MTRDDAWALAQAVADAGFSVGLSISLFPKHVPNEIVRVHPAPDSLIGADFVKLVELGLRYDQELHLIGTEWTYFDKPHVHTRSTL